MASVMMSPSRRAGVGERPWARAVTKVAGGGQLSPSSSWCTPSHAVTCISAGGAGPSRIAGPGSGNVRFKNCPPIADSQVDMRGRA